MFHYNSLCYDLIRCFGDLLLGTYHRVIAFQPWHHLCRSIIPFASVKAYRGVINEYRLPLHSFSLLCYGKVRNMKMSVISIRRDFESKVMYYQNYFY